MSNNLNAELEKQANEIRELEKQLLEDINTERLKEGKEPLKVDEYFADKLSKQLEKSIII